MDAHLRPLDELSIVRAEIDNSDLSKLAKRVLLLVTLVPEGRYTTVTAIRECTHRHFQTTGKMQVLNALERNVWSDVPAHRVMGVGGGGDLVSDRFVVVDEEENKALLAREGVKLDRIGRVRDAAFCFL